MFKQISTGHCNDKCTPNLNDMQVLKGSLIKIIFHLLHRKNFAHIYLKEFTWNKQLVTFDILSACENNVQSPNLKLQMIQWYCLSEISYLSIYKFWEEEINVWRNGRKEILWVKWNQKYWDLFVQGKQKKIYDDSASFLGK